MNLSLIPPVVSFTAATHKTFRHNVRYAVPSNVNIMIRGFATAATGNSESEQVVEQMNPTSRAVVKVLDRTTYTSMIDSLCKQDRIDEAYSVLNQMIVSGFSPPVDTVNNVLRGFLRIGDLRKAYDMRSEMNKHIDEWWMDDDIYSSLLQRLSNEVTYTSLMNAYFDEGKLDIAFELHYEMEHLDELLYDDVPHLSCLPFSVLFGVFINGLDDNKARTTKIKKSLLRRNYDLFSYTPTLYYRHTLVENCTDDEFKSLVELVQGFCSRGLENAYETMLKWNYKPDGIVYNLFIMEHCHRNNTDKAYNIYKEMVHYGFACHMFTVFALIQTLQRKTMVNELLWVIQNVLRSCNLNDSEILKFLDDFNPNQIPHKKPLFDVLAEKAKDGLFLKCSYAPPSA